MTPWGGKRRRPFPYDHTVDRLMHHLGEGNGYRAFFRQWAGAAGIDLDWRGLDPDRNGQAFRASVRGDSGPLRELVAERVQPLPHDRGHDIDR
jgi:hypothetical protein